jgi:hypothetical protein
MNVQHKRQKWAKNAAFKVKVGASACQVDTLVVCSDLENSRQNLTLVELEQAGLLWANLPDSNVIEASVRIMQSLLGGQLLTPPGGSA